MRFSARLAICVTLLLLFLVGVHRLRASHFTKCIATCVNTNGTEGRTITCQTYGFAANICACATSAFGNQVFCRSVCTNGSLDEDVCAWI